MLRKGPYARTRRPGTVARRDGPGTVSLRNFVRSTSLMKHYSTGNKRVEKQEFIHQLELALKASPELPAITLSGLADAMNLERTYCCSAFRKVTGQPFTDWRRRILIGKARELLLLTPHRIADIAYRLGFEDVTTFTRNFRKEVGMSPTSFRQSSQATMVFGAKLGAELQP